MPVKTPDDQKEQDSAYNPGEIHAAEQFDAYSGAGVDQAEAFANDPENSSKNVKDEEENPKGLNTFNFTGGGGAANIGGVGGLINKFKSGGLKKYGPAGGIAGVVIGVFSFFGIILSPGIAIVHMGELLTEDLNDQLAAMDIGGFSVFRSKIQFDSKSTVGCKIKVKCGFKGMSQEEVDAYRHAGIKVITGKGPNAFGKYQVKSLAFRDETGKAVVVKDVRTLNKMLKKNRFIENKFRRGQQMKLRGFHDKLFHKFLKRIGSSKGDKIKGKTEEDKWDNAKKSANTLGGTRPVLKPGAGDKTKTAFKNIGKFLNVFDVASVACTVVEVTDMVEKAFKWERALSLGNFAMQFLTLSSQIKDGSASPEDVEVFGNKITAVDLREFAITDNSLPKEDGSGLQKTKNPDYRKSGFDSAGYKVAAYNDAPTLSTRSMKYTVGGAVNGIFFNSRNKPSSTTRSFCGVVNSVAAQVIGIAIGSALAVFSGGAGSTALKAVAKKIAKEGAQGFLAGLLMAEILKAYLEDIKNGSIITDETKGVEAGDALFAGTAFTQGQTAQFRGLKPSESVEEIREYQALAYEVRQDYIAMEVEDAKKTPFDVMNQYSFLGSFARQLVPVANNATSSAGSALAAIPNFLSLAASTITSPSAGAVRSGNLAKFNPERFKKCNDEGYQNIGIESADVFCNLRYGLDEETLNLDVDKVISYMYDQKNCYKKIGYRWVPWRCVESDGSPVYNLQYEQWIKECAERIEGWGVPDGVYGRKGAECLANIYNPPDHSPAHPSLKMFRAYRLFHSIIESSDYENTGQQAGGGQPAEAGGGTISGDAQSLAQKIIDLAAAGKITIADYSENPSSDSASRSLASQQLQDIAAGKPVGTTTRCSFPIGPITPDPALLKFLAELGKKTHYTITSLFGQCHSNGSMHYQGKAVDFGCPLNTSIADSVGAKYGVSHNFENCSGHGHYHYSVGGS